MSKDQLVGGMQTAAGAPPADDGQCMRIGEGDAGEDIVKRLNLSPVEKRGYPKAVIVLVGTTDVAEDGQHITARLVQLFGRGLAKVAISNDALVIDASRGDGVAGMLSRAVFDGHDDARLIRVREEGQGGQGSANGTSVVATPKIRYSLDINVAHGSSSAEVINKIIDNLVQTSNIPVLTLLVNDGVEVRDVVAHTLGRGWPVIAMQNTGGLAKDIYEAWAKRIDYLQQLTGLKSATEAGSADKQIPLVEPQVDDLLVAEIITSSDLHFFDIDDAPEKLALYIKQRIDARMLLERLQKQQKVYSNTATHLQNTFRRQQNSILALGVLITLAAVLQTLQQQNQQALFKWLTSIVPFALPPQINTTSIEGTLHFVLILLPVLVTLLIAYSNQFTSGNRWVMVRTASEIYKREIFRYRTRTGIYSDTQLALNKTNRETALIRILESATKQWTENNLGADAFLALLETAGRAQERSAFGQFIAARWHFVTSPFRPKPLPAKKLPIYFTPQVYIEERLLGQLIFYTKNIKKLDRKLHFLQLLILVLGGVITILGALNIVLPIAVVTALATALGGYLEYTQVSNTLKQYKHVSETLLNLQSWWEGLGGEQADPRNVEKLVDFVETTLQTEQVGWVQQMQAALIDLHARQAKQEDATTQNIPAQQDGQVAGRADNEIALNDEPQKKSSANN